VQIQILLIEELLKILYEQYYGTFEILTYEMFVSLILYKRLSYVTVIAIHREIKIDMDRIDKIHYETVNLLFFSLIIK